MQTLFTVSKDEKNHGPFSLEQVSRQFLNGTFSENDYVYIDEKRDWIPLIQYLPDVAMKKKTLNDAGIKVEGESGKAEHMPGQKPTQRPYAIPLKLAERVVTDPPREKTVTPSHSNAVSVKPAAASPVVVVTEKPVIKPVEKVDEVHAFKPHQKPELKPGPKPELKPVGEVNGKKIEFVHTSAGPVQIRIKLTGGKTVALPGPISIVVKAAAAAKITMKGGRDTQAGETVKLHFEALDKYGNLDEEFNDSITVHASGAAKVQSKLVFVMGRAEATVTDNKAETVHVKMQDDGHRALDVSGNCDFIVKPGPTARIEVVGPDQVVAGQAAEFFLKTFDAFNNVTTDFDGSVAFEVDPKAAAA